VWSNKFLSIAVAAGFVLIFPLLYIPVINDVVFKHVGITWEWGIVFIVALLFFVGAETWKFSKRVFFRHRARNTVSTDPNVDVEERVFRRYLTQSSTGSTEKDRV
jgi:Na+-exporting ATPase